jgi:hypothetical protein
MKQNVHFRLRSINSALRQKDIWERRGVAVTFVNSSLDVNTWFASQRWLSGSQGWYGRCGQEKRLLPLPGNVPQFLGQGNEKVKWSRCLIN